MPARSTIPTRAAASSMASGMPSRRRAISATVAMASSSRRRPGRAESARSTNSSTAAEPRRSAAVASGPGTASEGTLHTVSPPIRSGSRLVASTRNPGAALKRPSTSSATTWTRCSQLSSTARVSRWPMTSATTSAGGRPDWGSTPSASATARGTRPGSASGARATKWVPPGKRPARLAVTSCARRVLPQPPAPARVTRRRSPTSAATSSTWPARPTKLLAGLWSEAAPSGGAGPAALA